jgi:hypothetical protein
MGHSRTVCQHDRLITQCRCPGPKQTKVVDCKNSMHDDLPVIHDYPGGPPLYVGKHRRPGTPVVFDSTYEQQRRLTPPAGRHRGA